MVRELGLERRETVRSLSTAMWEAALGCVVVREEPMHPGSGGVVAVVARYVANLENSNRWKQLKREAYQPCLLLAAARQAGGGRPVVYPWAV